MKILVIEDDIRLAENTRLFLEEEGYQVDTVGTGKSGLLKAKNYTYAVIVLDWMLPDTEGIQVLKQLRSEKVTTPVIMTTAKSQLEDKLEGFTHGVDDYLAKPYTLVELTARIKAIIRRVYAEKNAIILTIGDITINLDTAKVHLRDSELQLTPKEFSILELLMLHKKTIVSRTEILHHVWSDDVDQFTNHVEVHIKNLRKKLGDSQKLIKTVKGKGYIMTEEQ